MGNLQGVKTFISDEALEAGTIVQLIERPDGFFVTPASEDPIDVIGVTITQALRRSPVTVRLLNANGQFTCIYHSNSPCTAGTPLYLKDNGYATNVPTDYRSIGVAISAVEASPTGQETVGVDVGGTSANAKASSFLVEDAGNFYPEYDPTTIENCTQFIGASHREYPYRYGLSALQNSLTTNRAMIDGGYPFNTAAPYYGGVMASDTIHLNILTAREDEIPVLTTYNDLGDENAVSTWVYNFFHVGLYEDDELELYLWYNTNVTSLRPERIKFTTTLSAVDASGSGIEVSQTTILPGTSGVWEKRRIFKSSSGIFTEPSLVQIEFTSNWAFLVGDPINPVRFKGVYLTSKRPPAYY